MKFLILLGGPGHYDRWEAADEESQATSLRHYGRFAAAVRERGELVVGDALHHPDEARTVHSGRTRLVTEGPFTESVEQIAGFYLIDVPDLETAVELARLLPPECDVEVRPTLGVQV